MPRTRRSPSTDATARPDVPSSAPAELVPATARAGHRRATGSARKAASAPVDRAQAPSDEDLTAEPSRRRLSTAERESQIVAGAVRFFAERGLDGQLRDLAKDIGITHALLYHYFPTKQALIDRVYREVFEGRWNPAWERMLDDPRLSPEDKLIGFYLEYARAIFDREWVRIFVYSGLSDRSIPDRFFALLREKLFPRLIRETRRHCGITSRARPSAREVELLIGLHGGIFYIGIRRWIYEQPVHGVDASLTDEVFIRDRVRSYLLSVGEVLHGQDRGVEPAPSSATAPVAAAPAPKARRGGRSGLVA
jgi:AcrR family transcriptional regulator